MSNKNKFVMSNVAYRGAERLVKIILPSIGALYFSLSQIWGFPLTEQVVGTITVIATFLGIILNVSAKNYDAQFRYDGSLFVDYDEGGLRKQRLEFERPLDQLGKREEIKLKVEPYDQVME